MLLVTTSCAAERTPPTIVAAPAAAPAASAGSAPVEPRPKAPSKGFFDATPDSFDDDPSLPAGTVRVAVVDADGNPMPRAVVLFETVIVRAASAGLDVIAKETAVADDKGTAIFRKRSVDPGHHHVASTWRGDGTFSVRPFTLDANAGKRVVLHAYETVRAVEQSSMAMQTAIFLSVRADTIDLEVLHRIVNLGRTAWVPANVRVAFPPNVSDFFVSDLGMPVRLAEISPAGFSLVGTVPPGTQELGYHYRVPRDRSGSQRLVLDLPPRNAMVRVILDAGGPARLEVAEFSKAKAKVSEGKAMLIAERVAEPGTPGVKTVDITLAGDPR
ncbi:hypothetical protein A7982_12076 [Minicystis rosea]|nr:hypothetical protein A7982_12076 [Minicystis rosea]